MYAAVKILLLTLPIKSW